MPRLRFNIALFLTALLVLAPVSCSSRLAVYPVHGSVRSGNSPAARVMVVLHPLEEQDLKGLLPHGRTGNDGTFKIGTFAEGDGAPPGEYAVTVVWPELVKQDGEDSDGPDYLKGQFSSVEHPYMKVTIKAGDNELPPILLP